jgi:hypothetical protein
MLRSSATGLALVSVLVGACSAADPNTTKSGSPPAGLGDGEVAGARPGGSSSGEGGVLVGTPTVDGASGTAAPPSSVPAPSDTSAPGIGNGNVQPGTLTAGAWDDNLNFDFFLAYRDAMFESGHPGLLEFSEDDHVAAEALWVDALRPKRLLDVTLVIDTTGSMGDEMTYLQAEFIQLSNTIYARHPNSEQRWSLVVYKDTLDDYIVRYFDFRDDPTEFQQKLAAQSAGGGGDFPEAPERALETTAQLAWRSDPDAARLAFWVADAPYHTEVARAMASSVRGLQNLGIHVYPVASSGIDEFTELAMRSVAQLTGGRYLFLTDDSGVGGTHKEPTIPCYFVTKLDHAILRMVDIELSGAYREPEGSEVLRTGGNPSSGACTLASGEVVDIF